MGTKSGINTTFKDAVVPAPDVAGDWGGKLDNLEGGRGDSGDDLKGTDHASIEGAPGIGAKVNPMKIPGS